MMKFKTTKDKDGTIKTLNISKKGMMGKSGLHLDKKHGMEFSASLGKVASIEGGYSKKKKKGSLSVRVGKKTKNF